MAFDLFCLTKSKSSRRSQRSRNNDVQHNSETSSTNLPINSGQKQRNHSTTDNSNSTVSPLRRVTADFHAVEDDELTVYRDNVVFFEFSDTDKYGKVWAYVRTFEPGSLCGFVPSEILSVERLPQPIKKLSRSSHNHDAHRHSHRIHCTSEKTCHSNGGSIRLRPQSHLRVHPSRFDVPANFSLHGSSGCQTFQKFPDFTHFSPPSYYNLGPNSQWLGGYEAYSTITPFLRKDHGFYFVKDDFVAREENDLNVSRGDIVTVLNKDDKDWYWAQRKYDQKEGFVPAEFIRPYEHLRSCINKGNSTVTMKSSNHIDSHTYINHKPDRESLHTQQSSICQQQI